jgi:cytochrome b
MSTKKKKKSNPTKRNLYLDIGIASAFLIALSPDLTGNTIHEWFGLTFLGTLLVHLLLHWKWVVAITKKIFGTMPLKTRINYLLMLALLGSFAATGITGYTMGEAVGLGRETDLIEDLHELFANLSIGIVGAHVLMHTKWILNAIQRYILGITPGKRSGRKAANSTLAKQNS